MDEGAVDVDATLDTGALTGWLTGVDGFGVEETGTDCGGVDVTGVDWTGVDETGVDFVGVDETGGVDAGVGLLGSGSGAETGSNLPSDLEFLLLLRLRLLTVGTGIFANLPRMLERTVQPVASVLVTVATALMRSSLFVGLAVFTLNATLVDLLVRNVRACSSSTPDAALIFMKMTYSLPGSRPFRTIEVV